jgi:hypothetical protein
MIDGKRQLSDMLTPSYVWYQVIFVCARLWLSQPVYDNINLYANFKKGTAFTKYPIVMLVFTDNVRSCRDSLPFAPGPGLPTGTWRCKSKIINCNQLVTMSKIQTAD